MADDNVISEAGGIPSAENFGTPKETNEKKKTLRNRGDVTL
jgi:hypothetical protein